MDGSLVTIARFQSPLDANLARAQLEAAGIRAWLSNELASAYGGPGMSVDLQVAESDEVEALTILGHPPARREEPPASWREREEPERCPVCEGSLVQRREPGVTGRLVRFVFSVFLPLPDGVFASRRRFCGVCGFRWRAGEAGPERIPSIEG